MKKTLTGEPLSPYTVWQRLTGWTCASLEIRTSATRPSPENAGAVCPHRSVSTRISRRASWSRWMCVSLRLEVGATIWEGSFERRAAHAVCTSYRAVRRAVRMHAIRRNVRKGRRGTHGR